ncbi:MinD/ParA family ATP-binding protein [Natrarchaeobaculum sulfurireducens]|uniref:FleN family ATPase involved in flagellar biosynthesis n=1 Tax=Natrarchaeobaculum sulfurireducens TaxID=2044521 RepID=A0A346PG93_9EURY|nr:P-loop NTPase [Natrarchaeobaculum sulfurireducens]AXR78538.1 FleN family ATPase involved in flagellar biosynthesis [Natrarchaeobaculum sulfurireducens]AXR81410.1 Septum site-determining protein MinD [Natrarchaeobaculum sulfurireducens]
MIVAVAGGKGGVGTSTTAWNLAFELEAVAVDADLTGADLPLGSGPNLHDVLGGRANPMDAVESVGGVWLLSSGRTLAGARASDLTAFGRVLERIEREYGRVVIDCRAGLARDVGVALRSADLLVLVTTPTKPALIDALRTAELAAELGTPVASAVLNLADGDGQTPLVDRLSRTLGVEVTVVERQSTVADAQAEWMPVHEHTPGAQAVGAYRSLADRLVDSYDRLERG